MARPKTPPGHLSETLAFPQHFCSSPMDVLGDSPGAAGPTLLADAALAEEYPAMANARKCDGTIELEADVRWRLL